MQNRLQFLIFIVFLFSLTSCSEEELPFPEEIFTGRKIIDLNSEQFGEFETPFDLRVNDHDSVLYLKGHKGEINYSILSFSLDGEFRNTVRNFGPGNKDSVLVWDINVLNNGNLIVNFPYFKDPLKKIFRIYSIGGSLLNTLTLNMKNDCHIHNYNINNDNDLLLNVSFHDPDILHYSKDGELSKTIGSIADNPDIPEKFKDYGTVGIPFQDEYGNYYFFSSWPGTVFKYDKEGELLLEKEIEVPVFRDVYEDREKRFLEDSEGEWFRTVFQKVRFKNNKFYIYTLFRKNRNRLFGDKSAIEIFLHVIDTNLKVEKRIILNDDYLNSITTNDDAGSQMLGSMKFDIDRDENIYIPVKTRNIVLKFSPKIKDIH
ncbi:MAG: hypothetical protein GY863_10310 [bacterium]|nr:hypothetical protein [bacterium]